MELARRIANRSYLLERFESIRQRCGTEPDEPARTVQSRPTGYSPRRRLLSERFTEAQLLEIVDAYRNGMKQREVVAHYGISANALKILLRKHGARRCDA